MTNLRKIMNSIKMAEVIDLMKDIRITEGMEPDDFWFCSSENISGETSLYWLEYFDGGLFVMETAVGFVSLKLNHGEFEIEKVDKDFEIPNDGCEGVLWSEEVFEGRFIDACRYILIWREARKEMTN